MEWIKTRPNANTVKSNIDKVYCKLKVGSHVELFIQYNHITWLKVDKG